MKYRNHGTTARDVIRARGVFWYLAWLIGVAGYYFGLRSRRRCPRCRAIGTWKPYGGFWGFTKGDVRAVHRWVCKWCGYYDGADTITVCEICVDHGCWILPDDNDHKDCGKSWAPFNDCESNPWAG